MPEKITVSITADDRPYPTCDFCGQPYPMKWYPVRAFTMAVVSENDAGKMEIHEQDFNDDGWSACTACAWPIDCGDRQALLAQFLKQHPDAWSDGCLALTAEIYQNFWLHLAGPGIAYDPKDGPPRPPTAPKPPGSP